jgi:hypothetical protein
MAKNLSVPERQRQAIRRMAFTLSQIWNEGNDGVAASLAALAIKETIEILRDGKDMYGTERKRSKKTWFVPIAISDAMNALKEKK